MAVGLIELKIIVKGKTGHAANPSSGQNAIGATFKAYQKLELWLKKQNTTFQSSLNMAYIRGGLDLSKNNKDLVVGKEGNNIADIAKIIIDIRPGSDQVEAKLIVEVFEQFIKKQNCQIKSIAIRHNLSGWYTDKKELTKVLKTIGKTVPIRYDNPNKQGYVDIQMLDQAFSCPCLGFGPGEINQAHQRDENVAIKSIIKASQIYQNIIQAYCS